MVKAIAILVCLQLTPKRGGMNIAMYSVHDWDYIAAAHVRAVLLRHKVALKIVGYGLGNCAYSVDVPPASLAHYLQKAAPADRFSIHISGFREFTDDKRMWQVLTAKGLKSVRIGPTTLSEVLTHSGVPKTQIKFVRRIERSYLSADNRWHRGADVEFVTKDGGLREYQVYQGCSGVVVSETNPAIARLGSAGS